MSRAPWRFIVPLMLLAAAGPGWSQLLLPPPPLPQLQPQASELVKLEPVSAETLRLCVPRHGESGCAAVLYAQLLCALGDQPQPQALQLGTRWLSEQFQQAGLSASGVSPAQVEQLAAEEQVPQLCPDSSDALRRLFSLSRARP